MTESQTDPKDPKSKDADEAKAAEKRREQSGKTFQQTGTEKRG